MDIPTQTIREYGIGMMSGAIATLVLAQLNIRWFAVIGVLLLAFASLIKKNTFYGYATSYLVIVLVTGTVY